MCEIEGKINKINKTRELNRINPLFSVVTVCADCFNDDKICLLSRCFLGFFIRRATSQHESLFFLTGKTRVLCEVKTESFYTTLINSIRSRAN